jgi:hypothetical protein
MKKILAALVVTLALPAANCQAQCPGCGPCALTFGRSGTINYCWGIKICASLKANNGCGGCGSCGGCGGCNGPWYTYWPLEAHFQTPAPTGYPYWPSPMVSSLGQQGAGAYQQVGFQAPSYWYGH